MPIEIGRIEAIYRYPVKSMRGERLEAAALGWHGLEGDRRLALRRLQDQSGFPWLTAGKLPDLVRFAPRWGEDGESLHVVTPEGDELPAFSEGLAAEIGRRHGSPVQMMRLKHGIFDDASVSLIATATIDEVCRLAGVGADARRFRPNVVVRCTPGAAFEEDQWLTGVLELGDGADAPAVTVTMRDVRCAMVNIDPDGGALAPEVLKAVVRANDNQAGVYATVTRTGRLAVGQPVVLRQVSSVNIR